MEQDFNHISGGPSKPAPSKADTLSTLSLVAGIFAFVCFCAPPLQLLLGVSAIMLAIISKKGQTISKKSTAGMVLGALAVICSVVIFFSFLYGMQIIKDPANAELVKPIFDQYQAIFDSMQAQP